MSSQPFALDKLNYEALRKRKRRQFLRVSAIPVIVVFLIALWFALPMPLTHLAIGDYKKEGYQNARNWLTPLTWTSPEPFVIAFNSGTVDTKLGNYDAAEEELTRALALAPSEKKCMVAQNLVVALRLHTESVASEPSEAKVYSTRADTVMRANPDCFKGSAASGGSSSSGNSPTEAEQQQLEQKEEEGRERQEQFAQEEKYDPNSPQIKPW